MTKQLKLILALLGILLTILGFAIGVAYQAGCQVTTVKRNSVATSELYVDVKEIKQDMADVKTDVAITKERLSSLASGVDEIRRWIQPRKVVSK